MTQALNSVESWRMTVPLESLPEWITVPEAAFLTGTSVDSIQGLVDGRVLPWRPMSSARAAKRVALIRSRDVRDLAHSPAAVVKPAELRQRMVDRLPLGALASIVGAWVLAILATTTGKAAFFHHDRLIMGGTPVAAAIGLFFLSWLVMVGAIVGPSILIAWSRSNGQLAFLYPCHTMIPPESEPKIGSDMSDD